MGFKIDDKKLKRAGLDYWHLLDISHYDDIAAFFHAVTNGELCINDPAPDTSEYDFYYFTTKARRVYTEPSYANNSYIFFGSETAGLDEALLYRNPEQCVRFPMLADARCLNLSSSVAIGAFEVLRQWGFPKLKNYGKLAGE
jgi:tRNA (cytidine/uridine-2'-O-)-methyltransferase